MNEKCNDSATHEKESKKILKYKIWSFCVNLDWLYIIKKLSKIVVINM